MYVETIDLKPPTTLGKSGLDGRALAVGALVAVLAHVGLPLAVIGGRMLYVLLMMLLFHIRVGDETRPPLRDDHVVAAQFVRLGRPFDPRRLPNRRVPRLSTAPDHRVVVSKNLSPEHHEEPDMGARPPQAVLDKLARIGDRAQVFAELAEQREQEGDPNGVEEGEATAREGDVYLGQFVHFFHQGWSTPTTISDDVLSSLNAVASVTLSADGHLVSFEIARSSGDPDFDQSVLAQLQQLRDAGAPVPTPPASVADQYYGQTRNLRYNGRDAQH